MEMRQSLAQKSWARWKNVRDKFSPGQWRLLLLCLLIGFIVALATGGSQEPKETVKSEQPQTEILQTEKAKQEAPQAAVNPEPVPEPKEEVVAASAPIWPVEGRISREMGWYRTQAGDWRYHSGIDIISPLGGEVRAAAGGKIIEVGQEPSLGQFVKTQQQDITIVYGHLSAVVGKVGETVRQGQTIAYSGESGDCAEAAVHFGIIRGGQAQEPKYWLSGP